jgi:hypothetical protein
MILMECSSILSYGLLMIISISNAPNDWRVILWSRDQEISLAECVWVECADSSEIQTDRPVWGITICEGNNAIVSANFWKRSVMFLNAARLLE